MSAICAARVRSLHLASLLLSASCAVDWDGQVAEGVKRQQVDVDAGNASNADQVDTSQATTSGPAAASDEIEAVAVLPVSGPQLWLSADHGLVVDAGGRVLSWMDHSGRITALAESEELAPRTERHDGRPLVAFDGSRELRLPEIDPLSALTLFAVAEVAAEDRKCPSILHLSNSVDDVIQSDDLEFGRHQRELYYESGSKSVPSGATRTGSFSTDVLHVLAVRHEPTMLAVTRIDGADVHARTMELPQAVIRRSNYIGHNHYFYNGAPSCEPFLGRIGEIILYARLLDEGERLQVEQYLSEKWNVALQPAAP